MRIVISALLLTSLLATPGFALPPLAPGKPAGVKQADAAGTLAYGVIGGVAVMGILLALESHGAAKITSTTAPISPGDAAAIEAAALNTTR